MNAPYPHILGPSRKDTLFCWCGPQIMSRTELRLSPYVIIETNEELFATEAEEERFVVTHFDTASVPRGHGRRGLVINPNMIEVC